MSKALQRFGVWLLSERGRNFSFGAATTTSAALGCCFYFPHTFLLEQYKDLMHFYRHGFQLAVPPVLLDRFNKTLDLLEIPQYDRKRFRPFMVYGFDVFSAGSSFSRFGVIIGMPISFTHLDEDNVDTSAIQVAGESVQWELPEGQLLYKSLLVPEKAQMYAIAKEIEIRQTSKFLIDTISPMAMSVMTYLIGKVLNERFNLYAKPRPVRFSMYGLLGSFILANYLFVKDIVQVYSEKQVDEYLVKKDPIFKEGGKEYYELILKRNTALRKLMGKLGQHKYTIHGNENYLIRQKHLPLVQRKAFFEANVE